MSTPTDFGTQLRFFRDRANLTQEELAERAGLTRHGLALLERGERRPTWDTACALADALGVGVEEFRARKAEHPADLPPGQHKPHKARAPKPRGG